MPRWYRAEAVDSASYDRVVMPDGRPPDLPAEAPLELREFIECKRDSVTITQGDLTWLPLPPDIEEYAPTPTLGLEPGATPGTGTMTIGISFATLTIPVSIADGELHIDTSGVSSIPGAQEAIDHLAQGLQRLAQAQRQAPQADLDPGRLGDADQGADPGRAGGGAAARRRRGRPSRRPPRSRRRERRRHRRRLRVVRAARRRARRGRSESPWVTGTSIPGSGGGGASKPVELAPRPVAGPSVSSAPSTSTAPIAEPSTSTGPIAKPSTSTGPAVAATGCRDSRRSTLLELRPSVLTTPRSRRSSGSPITANDMYFPTPGPGPDAVLPESDLPRASGFPSTLTAEEIAHAHTRPRAAAAPVHQLRRRHTVPHGLQPGQAARRRRVRDHLHDPYAAAIPPSSRRPGTHSWAVFTNPDNDLATGFTSSAPDNYLTGADTYLEMLAFTDASGVFKNYILGDPDGRSGPRRTPGRSQGNLPTTGAGALGRRAGRRCGSSRTADFGCPTGTRAASRRFNRGANSPANLPPMRRWVTSGQRSGSAVLPKFAPN